ncbi:MAG: coenzyme F420-0:L-glutamate ligase [Candidatus Thorarchaeota archaeon]|jgi:coenzyme F420-0:L-glutamate ligase
MQVLPIATRIILPEDNFLDIVIESSNAKGINLFEGDILGIAETPLGTTEGRLVKLSDVTVTEKAKRIAMRFKMIPEIAQLVLSESDEILGGIPHVLLTIKNGTLMANAGVDKSNVPPGYASLLPLNPKSSAIRIRNEVKNRLGVTIGVLIIDSRTQPLRMGNIGMALGVAGFKPIADDRGRKDLFGNELRITRRAVADNLASACTAVMGESNESIPAVILRDAPVEFVDEAIDSSQMWISPEECMYMAIFKQWQSNANSV